MFILLFLLFVLAYGLIGFLMMHKNQVVKKRIEKFIPTDSRAEIQVEQPSNENKEKNIKRLLVHLSKYMKTRQSTIDKVEKKLNSAGLPLKPEEFLMIKMLTSLLLGGITFFITGQLFISVPMVVIGWVLPSTFLTFKIKKRLEKCNGQLPQTLDTMATAMRSGFSFLQAMQVIAKEVHDPIGPEFGRAIREINLGIPMEEAFRNLLNRLPNKDLEMVITAILIQRSTGGNLAQILETIKETITERIRMKEELRSLTAQGKMSAWVISLLPIILGFLLNVMNPTYFKPMLSHPLGWVLIACGACSGMIGWLVIQKIIRIEV